MRKAWPLLLPIAGILFGCAGGSSAPYSSSVGPGGSGGSGGSGSSSLLTDDEREVVLDSIDAAVAKVPLTDGQQRDPSALFAAVQKVSGLKNVQIGPDGSVIGLMADDIPFTVYNALQTPLLKYSPPLHGYSEKLPSHGKARILNGLDGFQEFHTTNDEGMLKANGYSSSTSPGLLPVYRALGSNPVGVLNLIGHGGPVVDIKNNTIGYGLYTRSPFSKPTDTDTKDDLKSGVVGFMLAPSTNGGKNEWHYSLLPGFITKYTWKLEPDSIVLITACSSGTPYAQNFRNALMVQGARRVTGWSDVVRVDKGFQGASLLLDKMLGANLIESRSPKERAFSMSAAKSYGDSKQVTRYTAGGKTIELKIFTRPGDEADPPEVLRPSIQYVTVANDGKRVFLSGVFGEDPGESRRQVIVGGAPASGLSWQKDSISCDVPSSGGDTYIEIRDLEGQVHKSNVRQLTRWTGTLRQTIGDGLIDYGNCTIKFVLMGDIGTFYLSPGATLQNRLATFSSTAPKLNLLAVLPSSVCTVDGGGTGTNSIGDVYTYTWNGGGHVLPLNGTVSRWKAKVGVPIAGGEGRLEFQVVAHQAMHLHIDHTDGSKTDQDFDLIFQSLRDQGNINQGNFILSCQGDSSISSGNFSQLSYKANWEKFSVTGAPDPNSPR